MTHRTSHKRTSIRRHTSRHLVRNASRPEVTKAIRKVAAAYLKLYSIPIWRDPKLQPAYAAAMRQVWDANDAARDLARTEKESTSIYKLILKSGAVAGAKAQHARDMARGTKRDAKSWTTFLATLKDTP